MKTNWIFIVVILLWSICGFSQTVPDFKTIPHSELLILGTFHFNDAGLDDYKPKHQVDILSESRQQELLKVLEVLQKYQPTKIAVEVQKERQPWLDSLYTAYLDGKFELKSNEIYQIGFRMGKLMKHKRIYAIDAGARGYLDTLTSAAHTSKQDYFTQQWSIRNRQADSLMHLAFYNLYAHDDSLKTTTTLLDFLRYQNSTERLRLGHGHYLIGSFKMGKDKEYYGPDNAIWWYSRNSRIFHNLLQIQEIGKDKVLLLIGAGHVPILNFLAEASPDFVKRNLEEFLD